MSSSAEAIVEELKAVFPSKRPHPFVPMANSTLGDEPLQVAAAFADKDDWTELRPDWLDDVPEGLGSALSFLSDEAIRFYIPAYIAADLSGALGRVDPAFILTHGFDDRSRGKPIRPRGDRTWTDFSRARWDSLTRSQATAIAHYLEWCVRQRGGAAPGHALVEALAAYWYPRAGGLDPVLSPADDD